MIHTKSTSCDDCTKKSVCAFHKQVTSAQAELKIPEHLTHLLSIVVSCGEFAPTKIWRDANEPELTLPSFMNKPREYNKSIVPLKA